MIEAISVDGFTLSLLIILLGKGLIEDWFTHTVIQIFLRVGQLLLLQLAIYLMI